MEQGSTTSKKSKSKSKEKKRRKSSDDIRTSTPSAKPVKRNSIEIQNKLRQGRTRIKSVLKGGSDFDSSLRIGCTSVTLFIFAFFGFYYVTYMRNSRNLLDCMVSGDSAIPLTPDEAVLTSDYKNMSKRWQRLFIFTFIAEVLSLS